MQEGKLLRIFRISNDLSISKLSELAGCSKSYLTELEKGKKTASSEMLDKLIGAMNINIKTFLEVKNKIEKNHYEQDFQKCLYIVLKVYL